MTATEFDTTLWKKGMKVKENKSGEIGTVTMVNFAHNEVFVGGEMRVYRWIYFEDITLLPPSNEEEK